MNHNVLSDLCVSKCPECVHKITKSFPSSVEALEMLMVILYRLVFKRWLIGKLILAAIEAISTAWALTLKIVHTLIININAFLFPDLNPKNFDLLLIVEGIMDYLEDFGSFRRISSTNCNDKCGFGGRKSLDLLVRSIKDELYLSVVEEF